MTRRLLILVGIGMVLVLLAGMGALPTPIVFLGHLLVGWAAFIGRVLPAAQISGAGVLSAMICLACVLVLGHGMARWFWRDSGLLGRSGQPWRLRWTLAGVGIVVLAFVAGIGATGVTHQSAWLARSDRPMFEYRGREGSNRIKCASNLRQIYQAIEIYAADHHGTLPASLKEAFLHCDITAEVFVCPSSNDERAKGDTQNAIARQLHDGHCSYVYHGRGLTLPLHANRPLACEPLVNHNQDGINVLWGDGDVEWMSPAQAQDAISGARQPSRTKPAPKP